MRHASTILLCLTLGAPAPTLPPPPGQCFPVRIIDVPNGSELQCETLPQAITIRLTQCYTQPTYRKTTKGLTQEQIERDLDSGLASQMFLKELVRRGGNSAVVTVPYTRDIGLPWWNGTLCATVHIGNTNLSDEMVRSGFATKVKNPLVPQE